MAPRTRTALIPLEDDTRFWNKVILGDCWEWTGSGVKGYGRVMRGGVRRMVHRHVWEELVGPVPEGLELDHLCRNRRCCNPDHLEPVTPAENQRRGYSPSGFQARKERCIRGHRFSRTTKQRYCKQCRIDRRADRGQ